MYPPILITQDTCYHNRKIGSIWYLDFIPNGLGRGTYWLRDENGKRIKYWIREEDFEFINTGKLEDVM